MDSAARVSEANRTDIKLLLVNLVYCMLKCLVYIVVCFILSDILTCVNKPNLEAGFLEWRNAIQYSKMMWFEFPD